MTYRIDPAEIRRAIELFLAPGQVTELRALDCTIEGNWRSGQYSGYFDREHVDDLVAACAKIKSALGTYFIPNPVDPELIGRAFNRARIIGREPLTTDVDIVARRWLLVDVDASKKSGLSATEAEKRAAEKVILDCDYELWEAGFPAGIFADSGNGAHLLIPINRPADDGGFCQKILKWLAERCDTDAAKVDQSVYNPARIWKLPGTMVCKGDHCPAIGREWRMARITQVLGTDHARSPNS